MPQRAIDVASNLLNEAQFTDLKFTEQFNNAIAREAASSDRSERLYNELIAELIKVVETPNM